MGPLPEPEASKIHDYTLENVLEMKSKGRN